MIGLHRAFGFAGFLLLMVMEVGNVDYAEALNQEAEEKVARVHRVLLETSAHPASLDECQRANPSLPRPDGAVSQQHRTLEPWQRRTCIYLSKGVKQ